MIVSFKIDVFCLAVFLIRGKEVGREKDRIGGGVVGGGGGGGAGGGE